MTGTEIDVFMEGEERPVGRLTGDDAGALAFAYAPSAGRALSLALPLPAEGGREHYGDVEARTFFDNLLPENASLDEVMARHGVGRDDIAGLLYHLGRDCPGAISCVPAGEGPGKRPGDLATDYDILRPEDLAAVMVSLRDRGRLPAGIADPSPLAGVQRKLALVRFDDGRFGLPRPGLGVPTTHILKVPRRGEERLVDHEAALMAIARHVTDGGAARAETVEIEATGDGPVRGLLVERFDRSIAAREVRRLHQEDFAQALGLPRRLKYQRDGVAGRMFDAAGIGALLARTAVPAASRLAFLRATLLNLALGNTDNHAKNHALLYRGSLPDLAPLYDIVPVLIDPAVTHDFSFRFGGAERMADVVEDDLFRFAGEIGFRAAGSKAGGAAIRREAATVLSAVAGEVDGLGGPGLKLLGDMIADQVAALAKAFDIRVDLPERDAFRLSGGGFPLPS